MPLLCLDSGAECDVWLPVIQFDLLHSAKELLLLCVLKTLPYLRDKVFTYASNARLYCE